MYKYWVHVSESIRCVGMLRLKRNERLCPSFGFEPLNIKALCKSYIIVYISCMQFCLYVYNLYSQKSAGHLVVSLCTSKN